MLEDRSPRSFDVRCGVCPSAAIWLPAPPGRAGPQALRVRVLGIVQHPDGRPPFDYCPAVQYERFVGELADDGQIVADQDVGDGRFVADIGE